MTKSSRSSRTGKSAAAPARRANRAERYAAGKALRDRVPREQHGEWKAAKNRHDPVDLVIASSKGRVPGLISLAVLMGTAFEQSSQRFREPGRVRQTFLSSQNDKSKLRHRASLSLQINRFNERHYVFEGNDQQIASNDHRALLVPQSQLRRKLRILIDSGLDLQRSVDEA